MKRHASLIFLLCIIFCSAGWSTGANYDGQWRGTVTESTNTCERIGKADPGDYILTILHQEERITIMDNVEQRPYTGAIDPEKPAIVVVKGTYAVDGGYLTEMVTIDFVDDNSGNGKSTWHWSDGYHSCGGRFAFSLKKIKP
jgi:hypothetical protein